MLIDEKSCAPSSRTIPRYYDGLGKAPVYERRPSRVLDHQRRGLATIGGGGRPAQSVSIKVRLLAAIVAFGFKAAISPAGALRALRGLKRR